MTHTLSPIVTTTDDDEVTAVITGKLDMPATFTTDRRSRGSWSGLDFGRSRST